MDRSQLPNAILKYQPAGKRNPGHPLKRLVYCYTETTAGYKAQVPDSIMMMILVM
jgi:hypothetical protein